MTNPRQVAVRLYTRFDERNCAVSAAMIGDVHVAVGAKLRVELVTGDTGGIEGQWRGRAKTVMRRTIRRLLPGAAHEVAFPLSRIPEGAWCFRPTFIDRHGRACETHVVQTRLPERPEWFGSSSGVTRDVPPPWTPLQTRGESGRIRIACWGREYAFDRTSVVHRIRSLDRPLLAGPVRLTGRVDGRAIRWSGRALQCLDRAPDQTVLTQTMQCGTLCFEAQIEVEFDGMVRFDWRIASADAVIVDQLTVDVPLCADSVRLFYQWRGKYNCGDDREMGALRRGTTWKGFRPYVWLGDEERGLAWFAESDRCWFNADPHRAIEIKRQGETITLRLHLVSKPVRLVKGAHVPTDRRPVEVDSLRYTFGLQATPVRPVDKDAWDYRCFCLQQNSPGVGGQLRLPRELLDRLEAGGVRTVIVFEHWTDWEAHCITAHKQELQTIVRACHERGIQVLLYFGFLLSEHAPEFPALGETALQRPKTGWSVFNYPPQPVQVAWRVCQSSAWQDFVPHGVAHVMDEFDVDGVYLDGTSHAYACRNLAHGCGVLRPDGSVAPIFPIFAVRSAMRRLYSAVMSRKADGQVNTHNSADMVMPTLGFSTSTWDGEQFAGLRAGTAAEQFLPLDAFRTEFMGHQWGVPAELLCYVDQPLKYRQAWALSIVHDVPVRAMLAADPDDLDLNAAIWRVMDEFGRKQARFLGYWCNRQEARTSPKGAFASVYVHPTNGRLLAVSNLTQEARTVRVRLLKVAGTDWRAVDALTARPLPRRGRTIELQLGPLDFALVHVS